MANGSIFAAVREREQLRQQQQQQQQAVLAQQQSFGQDIGNLQQFLQSRRQLSAAEQRLAQLRGLSPEQRIGQTGLNFPARAKFPTPRSQAGGGLFSKFLLQQQKTGLEGLGVPSIPEQRARQAQVTGAVPGTAEFEKIAKGPKAPPSNTPAFFIKEFGFTPKEAQAAAEITRGLKPKTINQLSSLELTRMSEVLQSSASPEAFATGQKIAVIAAQKVEEELRTGKPFSKQGVPRGLEDVWPSMSNQEKSEARRLLGKGTVTVPQILERLK